ncbi:MAG: hypothetical protein J6386_04440 [Candidatus Synoicihabitans palmerolidicus]|nr:hypothetical protein [Candidatus Synoicihabitans palmerolidicus]
MNNTTEAVAPEVALKTWLRPDLTPVGPNKDYAALRDQLAGLDQLLANSHLEARAVDFARENWRGDDVAGLPRHLQFARKTRRVQVLRMMLGNISLRKLSLSIASSDLLADFCGARRIDGIKGVSQRKRAGACVQMLHRRAGAQDEPSLYRDVPVRRTGRANWDWLRRSRWIRAWWTRPACRPTSISRSTGCSFAT